MIPRCRAAWAVALLALTGLAGAGAAAQGDYRVRAYIQPEQDITEQQTVRLVIEAEGQGSPQLSAGGLEGLENLQVVGRVERQFNSTWANGRLTARTSLVYTLLPLGAGAAAIPALSVEIDGRKVTTPPIQFNVGRAAAGTPPRSTTRQDGSGGASDAADVFVRAQLGSADVWVGESVSLAVLLYSAEQISTPATASQPALARFWVEELEVDPQAEASRATVEGRSYTVFPWIRKILVPQTAGSIEIEPFVLQIPVSVRSRDPFQSLFSLGRTRTVVRKTAPLTLNVRPLPSAGRPANFGGAVGTYTLKVALDRQEATVNDAVALSASVEGEGFLRTAAPPTLDVPPHINVFDPKVKTASRNVRGKLVSQKSWEWILVPLVAGELKIPPLRFPYFDSAAGTYREATVAPGTLVVRQGVSGPDGTTARGRIQLQRKDLAFIKPLRGTLQQSERRAHRSVLFVVLLLLPLAWAPAVVLAGRHRAKLQRDLGLARSRKARARARNRLRSTRKRSAGTDSATFHEEVARALVEYLADRFDRAAAGMTYQIADELLASRGVEEPLRRRYRSCLESCDFARFVPAASGDERRAELLCEAERIVEEVESAW